MSNQLVLIDSDFHALADDHEALLMMVARHQQGHLRLGGLTTVTGNTWAGTGALHAAQALAFLGVDDVPVVEGAGQPLLHRQADFAHRSRLYGAAFGGAWGSADLLGEAPSSKPALTNDGRHAVEFMIDVIRRSPQPITMLAIGPLTNLALALRLAPDICDNIQQVVCMGGAFFVHGNVTPSAEFNWWFDPEAAAIVLEENLDLVIVPLDATDTVVLDIVRFRDWSSRYGRTAIFERFHRPKLATAFAGNPGFELPLWDAVAAVCLLDPRAIARKESLWVSVDCSAGPSYGRVVAYADPVAFNLTPPARRPASVVLEIDSERFWTMYEELVFQA